MNHRGSARTSFCVSICHFRWHTDVFRKISERHSHGLEAFPTQMLMLISNSLRGHVLAEKSAKAVWQRRLLAIERFQPRNARIRGSKSDERNTRRARKIRIRRVWPVRKRTNQVRFYPCLLFREEQLNSNDVWLMDRLQTEIWCIFNDWAISCWLVMIRDTLLRRKMINVNMSTRKNAERKIRKLSINHGRRLVETPVTGCSDNWLVMQEWAGSAAFALNSLDSQKIKDASLLVASDLHFSTWKSIFIHRRSSPHDSV